MPAPLSRRAALAAPVALAAATAGAAPTHPDAALIAACEELKAAERATREADAAPSCSDAEMHAVCRRWSAAVEAVSDLPATTPAGVRAKAEAVLIALRREVTVFPGETFEASCAPHEWLAFRLAEDIVLRM
jgi:hypothetical protein